MQRNFRTKTRGELFVERVVWNAAAGAALAVMVLLLLFSLRWLDQVAPHRPPDSGPGATMKIASPAHRVDRGPHEVVADNRPSG